jgi:hypothetical protein
MKGWSSLVFLLAVVPACSSTGGSPAPPAGPLSWPAGQYRLEATVRYNSEIGPTRDDYFADLTITLGGSMILTSSSGNCQDPSASAVQRDMARGRRSFECGDVTFDIRPMGQRIGGEILASVRETYRERGPCRRYETGMDGQRVCVEYSSRVLTRTSLKRERLRIS